MIHIGSILVPTDFSESSDHALKYALSFAREYEAKLYVLHVVEDAAHTVPFDMVQAPPMSELLSELVERSREEVDAVVPQGLRDEIEWEGLVRRGVPFYEIVRAAAELDVDLIICGTHGRTGLKHMIFGSVAEKVVRKASCPVLSVRHPEHKVELTPVEDASNE